MTFFTTWALFFLKTLSVLLLLLVFLMFFLIIIGKAKARAKEGELQIKCLNEAWDQQRLSLWQQVLDKKELKKQFKEFKKEQKKKNKSKKDKPRLFVISFKGDLQASESKHLAEEITAILQIAKPKEEVLLKLESPGGVVHGYGYAASQLQRLRDHHLHLTIAVDRVAASGGYMMAAVANTILAAPFAVVGSIGVLAQLPNFHRLLEEKGIDFEQISAGEYKRTLSVFGKNTKEGREKTQEQLEEIHQLFKNFIAHYRPQIELKKVATGEYWLAKDALDLKLVDALGTSDAYLLKAFEEGRDLFELKFIQRKSLKSKLGYSAKAWSDKLLGRLSLLQRLL